MSEKIIAQNEVATVSLGEGVAGYSSIKVDHPEATAEISLYGGHLVQWVPQGQAPVFWVSKSCQSDRPIRGGVPVCWPWFGAVEGADSHGFARKRDWQLVSADITVDTVIITLRLQGENESDYWPHRFHIEQKLVIGKCLEQSLSVHNSGQTEVQFTAAFHSYFSVSQPHKIDVPALNGARYKDKFDDFNWHVHEQPLQTFDAWDRVYESAASVVLEDTGMQRRICLDKQGSGQWVLWNPGPQGVKSFSDIHSGGEQEFVCLETAITEAIAVLPGQTYRWGHSIRLENY